VTRHRECGEPVHARLLCDAGHTVAQHELRAEPLSLDPRS